MEKDVSQNLGGSFLPVSGRHSGLNNDNAQSEPLGTTRLPPIGPGSSTESSQFGGHGTTSDSSHFSHDISRMPDNPPKYKGHRRAHSEIVTLPDDISFDTDLGVVGGFDGPLYSDETEEDMFSSYLDMDRFNSSSATSGSQVGESSSAVQTSTAVTPPPENHGPSGGERPRLKHQHSLSMDGSTTIKTGMLTSYPEDTSKSGAKKSISTDKLAELALVDPKRAKRIWANRQSAARSKERKMRYIAELERKVHGLQTEATSLSAQLALLQRDTNGLSAENGELKMHVQTMEQQVHLQDSLNDALKEEIQHLKVLTGQNLMNGGPMMNHPPSFGANHQFRPTVRPLLTAHQFQQLHIQPHKQQHPFPPQQLRQFHQPSPQQPPQSADLKNRSSASTLSLKEHNSSEFRKSG